jgi:hypothetical protein
VSGRRYSGRLREPEYPTDHQVRRVRSNGEIKWHGGLVFLGEALIGEPIGIEESDDGLFIVSYGPIELGWIDQAANFIARRSSANPAPSPQPQPPG